METIIDYFVFGWFLDIRRKFYRVVRKSSIDVLGVINIE